MTGVQTCALPIWFSLFDVDYDGFVDSRDLAFSMQSFGDFNNDNGVDLKDYQAFQVCFTRLNAPDGTTHTLAIPCLDAFDFDGDQRITLSDFEAFQIALTGP